ncbi:MAG TPA: LuxR C-terminal-related transcriptional regulator [Thermomicrobiales bacterium]|nr:LuxR C-terminal-related transcriptional regulator [Thermomicrobiales bacterium]
MPDRAGLTHPKDAVARPELRMTDGVPEQDDVASLRVRILWIRHRIVEPDPGEPRRDPGEPRRFNYGDLLEGTAAVAALLMMLVLGLPPWLAILLSVVTYIAVALLRPARERSAQAIDGTAAEQPDIEVTVEDRADQQVPNGEFTGAEAMVACFGLTRREREILPLLAQRLTDREIAERLSISHRTAMNHTANILHKLGLESRRDVAAFIARHEILLPVTSPDEPE